LASVGKAATAIAVGANKVGIAELANCIGAVLFFTAPEVAAGKTTKYRRSASVCTFALE
jgi:hypothetical protein